MSHQIDARAVQGVLYGLYKAIHGITRESAGAVMRKAAPDILIRLAGGEEELEKIQDLEALQAWLKEKSVNAGLCADMSFERESEDSLRTNITDCAFFALTTRLKEEGIPPFGCPFAALTMALAERNLNKQVKIKELQPVPGGKPGDTTILVSLS